jgi:hypothetical protein
MRYSAYPKEMRERERERIRCRQTIQSGCKEQASHAFSLQPSLHNLHLGWLFVWPGPEQCLQGHSKDFTKY